MIKTIAAILGYILASLEGADPMKTAMLYLFHDTHEARINDMHSRLAVSSYGTSSDVKELGAMLKEWYVEV